MTRAPATEILRALAQSPNTLSDATTEMPYADIAQAVAQVNAALDERGIATADCLAFSCGNDVPSAIVLLALLTAGRTFLLLPAPRVGPGNTALPQTFCRYHLRAPARQDTARDRVAVSAAPLWLANPPAGPPSFFVLTSGSTASAKIVRHTHDRLLRAAACCAERLGLKPADRIALPMPVAHMYGLGAAFVPSLLAGACIDIQANANVPRYFARERLFGPTVAFLVPSFGESIVQLRKARHEYRLTVMAGDRLTPDLFDRYERLHGCVVNLYGSTELGVIAAGDPADPPHLRRAFIGRPMPGAAICNGAACGDVAAPLCFKHDFGFEGYAGTDGRAVREPDGSLTSSGCFQSNDVGRMNDGYLVVDGRGDDLVKRDGLLTDCNDVAAAIRGLPGIVDAAVLSGAMSRRGRALTAFCMLAEGCHWEIVNLRRACADVLPPRAIPDAFLFLPALPRLAGGKIDRTALRRLTMSDDTGPDGDIL